MEGGFDHWVWLIPAVLIGACIGSFLNVVIYRVPLGISVNKPKRSYCPLCEEQLEMWHNLPVFSWFLLRGKCGFCKAPISFRYPLVELITAVLFGIVWYIFPPEVVLLLWVFVGLSVAITWIDAEHLIIPVTFTWGGVIAGVIAACVWPPISDLAGYNDLWSGGLKDSAVGWVVGFFGLWAVVELGKKAFGKRVYFYENPVPWALQEPESEDEPLYLILGDEKIAWWDIFSRKTDRLLIDCDDARVDGQSVGGGLFVLSETTITSPGGEIFKIEDIRSLDGMAREATIPREAMGMGDVHLLGMIGAFFGWAGVFFALFSASLFAIFAAVIGRIGFGRQLPFGPFLVLGGFVWMFGGWRLWRAYMDLVGF